MPIRWITIAYVGGALDGLRERLPAREVAPLLGRDIVHDDGQQPPRKQLTYRLASQVTELAGTDVLNATYTQAHPHPAWRDDCMRHVARSYDQPN